MGHKRTTIGMLLIGVLLIGALSGCGAKSKEADSAATTGRPAASAGQNEQLSTPEDSSAKQKQTIHVYLTDEDLTVLVEQSREIEYDTDEEKIAAALTALQADGEGDAVSLWSKVDVLSAELKDGAVTINIHLPEGSRLGAPGEAMALEALKKTLFQFDGIQSIDVLVDGEAVESLMGHEDLPHPILK